MTPPIARTVRELAKLRHDDAQVRAFARQLVGDVHLAEDVTQQAWLAACERGPADAGARKAWLKTAVRFLAAKARRREARTRHRESVAARPEATASTSDIVERESLRRTLVDSVLELAEPYRTTLLLRYFEDLPPRAIARRMSAPVETVRTRIARAHDLVRKRLEQTHSRTRWRGSFALLALGAPRTAATTLPMIGAFWMGSKIKLVMVATASLAMLWGGWSVFATNGTPPEVPSTGLAAELRADAGARDAGAVTKTIERVAAAPRTQERSAPMTTGTLRVTASWSDDGTPAVGQRIGVFMRGLPQGPYEDRLRTTDEAGVAVFGNLPVGRSFVSAEGSNARFVEAQVVAGQSREVALRFRIGQRVSGVVVDPAGVRVAGAKILLAPWAGGLAWPATTSNAEGRFELRTAAANCRIGARADGFAPTPQYQIQGTPGTATELRLDLPGAGGVLRGVVLGPNGNAIAGANVFGGDPAPCLAPRRIGQSNGRNLTMAHPQVVQTDAAGRFELRSLPLGALLLGVRAAGLATKQQTVAVRTAPSEVVVQLEAGVRLRGLVRDREGRPVRGADVRVGDYGNLAARATRSGRDGSYEITDLVAGTLQARAAHEKHGRTTAELTGFAGQTLRWDPVLGAGLVIRGRVIDERGAPIANLSVEATHFPFREGDTWMRFASTDASGRFTLRNCVAGRKDVRLTFKSGGFARKRVANVAVGGPEMLIRLPDATKPTVRIQGLVVSASGKPVSGASVHIGRKGDMAQPVRTTDAAGRFDFGPFPPGNFFVVLSAPGLGRIHLGSRKLAPHDVWDLGRLTMSRGGTISARLRSPSGALVPLSARLVVRNAKGAYVTAIQIHTGEAESERLAPGRYEVQLRGKGIAEATQPVVIHDDAKSPIEFRVR